MENLQPTADNNTVARTAPASPAATPPPNYFGMRRHLIRIRNGTMPPSPNTPLAIRESFEIPEILKEYGTIIHTATDESIPFYRCVQIEDEFAYCVFASERIINEIKKMPAERRHYYMDGTFKVVPYGAFNQLLIIYVEFFQKVKNCIFIPSIVNIMCSLSLSLSLLDHTIYLCPHDTKAGSKLRTSFYLY